MTNGILKPIKTKNTLYKKLVKANIDDEIAYTNLKAEFTDYKKILRRSINEAKHSYYARTFTLYKNDIKQTWSVIKDTLQRKNQSRTTAQFILNNRIITDLDEIANEFNAYFVGIGRLLSEQIHSDSSKPLTLLINQCLHNGVYPSQLKMSSLYLKVVTNHCLITIDQFLCYLLYLRFLNM